MMVFELFYPGTWIDLPDRQVGFEVLNHVSTVESRLSDAAVALFLFEQAQAQVLADLKNRAQGAPVPGQHEPDDSWQLGFDPGMDGQTFLLRLAKQQLEAKRRRWEAGELPRAYTSRLPFIYARSFLFSVWDICKLLTQIGKCQGVSTETTELIGSFDVAFPTLKGLRDSSAHIEERVAGQAHGRPIAAKPVESTFIRAPAGGVLVLESLLGNKFIGTAGDGELAEIEVSVDSMTKVQECFQRVLNSLPWSGPGRHYPE